MTISRATFCESRKRGAHHSHSYLVTPGIWPGTHVLSNGKNAVRFKVPLDRNKGEIRARLVTATLGGHQSKRSH